MALMVHRIQLLMSVAYLLEVKGGLILVDAGLRGEEGKLLRRIRDLDRDDLKLIFITHAHLDHYGSAAALRRATGASIAIHRADAEAMSKGETILGEARSVGKFLKALMPLANPILRAEPTTADLLFEEGTDLDEYGIKAKVLHTPGHTKGSCCLITESGIAFSGDLVTTTGRPHMLRAFAQDWSSLATSFARLQARQPEIVYPGHGRRPLNGANLQRMRVTKE
jgi:glyoxylase-like metal-dependent hydrolase (beta-lactamase superfamily II)